MNHVDEETLVLLALGEPAPSPDVTAHVHVCPACTDELDALRRVTAVARDVDRVDRTPPAPPAHVWDAIVRELDRDGAAPGTGRDDGQAAPTPLRAPSPSPRWQPWLLGAAAAFAVVVVALAALLPRLSPDVVTETTLAAVESDRSVPARVVRSGDELRLEVDAGALPPTDGYYEVWLADPSVQRLLSLGPLTGGEPITLPDSVDLADFPVVDVSVEPLDGDPTHSGRSLWRGRLPVT